MKFDDQQEEILRLGYDVIFSDTDVVIVSDPFPTLLWKNVDYIHCVNEPCPSPDR